MIGSSKTDFCPLTKISFGEKNDISDHCFSVRVLRNAAENGEKKA